MSTQPGTNISHDLILAARQGLIPMRGGARLGGFSNMLRKELSQFWGTRAWWVQTLIWVLILNGITTIVMLTETLPDQEKLQVVVQTYLPLSAVAIGIGTVIAAQGAIVGEKQLGTAAWVMSKPASRSAFILAKTVAYEIGYWVTAIIIPASIFVVIVQQLVPAPLQMTPFLAGLSLVALGQLFYLTLTLMLGTFFNSRGPIAGIGIAFILTGMLLKGMIPQEAMMFTPWLLPDLSSAIALGMPLPEIWFVPILATVAWIAVMTLVSLWRFGGEEF